MDTMWLRQLEQGDGWLTSRTVPDCTFPINSARVRFSLSGQRTERLDLAGHHTFASPRVIRAEHILQVSELRKGTEKVKPGDCVQWRNRRQVSRNLFLDRVPAK